MIISLDIQKSVPELIDIVLKQFRAALNKAIRGAIPPIRVRLGTLMKALITQTPEFQSLINGKLKHELGLVDASYALVQILDKLTNNITIKFDGIQIKGDQLEGNLDIGLVWEDFSNILHIPDAVYYSGGNRIPWLEWLLFKGDSIIIAQYSIRYFDAEERRSRTGSTLMIKSERGKGWRVPPEFSGIKENNFITRAFTDYPGTEQLIGEIIEEEIVRRL